MGENTHTKSPENRGTIPRNFCLCSGTKNQGPLNGGVSNGGGFPDLDLSFLFLSFFVLFGTFPIFRDFPVLFGDGPGIFPICPFPLSRPIKSAYEEQSRKGPRHNLDL